MKLYSIVLEIPEKWRNLDKYFAQINFCLLAFFLISSVLPARAGTTVLYQPSSQTVGPFPANVLTTADSQQMTGLRVNLPASFDTCDPESSPSVCSNTALLNQLDGFSVNPRIMVCFSGPIDTTTLSNGVTIVPLAKAGAAISINQIFYDPETNCAFAKPNQVLNQQSQYLLTVSDSVHDAGGTSVVPDAAFTACLQGGPDAYCAALSHAVKQVKYPIAHLTSASLFTTLSATIWMENARRFVNAHQLGVALPAGLPSTFALSQVSEIRWVPQGTTLTDAQAILPLNVLSGVQSIAFGLYLSPNFLNPLNGSIATTPTSSGISGPVSVPLPVPVLNISSGYVPVSYHVFLPATPAPPAGFPVVIYGHGLGDNQFGGPTFIAGTLAKRGFATLAIEITGHGYGALSVVNVKDTSGVVHTVLTPGRGILIPGNSQIGPADGCVVPGAIAVRDCGRQTAIDLLALVRTIQETNGLGLHLDPKHIYYVGQSFGADYGTLFQSLASGVGAAVFSGDGGSFVDVARLSISGRPLGIEYLASVSPALLNARAGSDFNDNYVFRDQPPVINNVPEAPAIQAAFEAADWLNMLGDPLAYAPHLKTSPLAGISPANTLFQFGYGDLEMPNPTQSAVIRAANDQASSWYLRFDTATQIDPLLLGVTYPGVGFPILPHRILSNPTIFDPDLPDETSIALAAQQQVADYFASGGRSNPNPNAYLTGAFAGTNLFEVPTTLPESLNFLIPISE